MQSSRLQPSGCRPRHPLFRPGAPGPAQAQPRPVLQAQRQSGCPQAAKPRLDVVTSRARPHFTVITLCKHAVNAVAGCTTAAFGFVSHALCQDSGTLRASIVCQASFDREELGVPTGSGLPEDSSPAVHERPKEPDEKAKAPANEPKGADASLDAVIATVTDEDAKQALMDNKDKLLQEKLTTAARLKHTTLQQLKDMGIRLGDANLIKAVFMDAGVAVAQPGRSGSPVKLVDVAAKLVQHVDDPTMYTVKYPDGREALFHDPAQPDGQLGSIGQLRHYLSAKVQPQWCSQDAGRQILPLYISGGIKSGKTFLMNVILPALMADMAVFANTSSLQLDVSVVNREEGYDALCKSLLGQVLERAAAKRIVTQALQEASMERADASLMRIFETMDVPLTIQMDEVQHLLSPRRRPGRVDKGVQRSVARLLKALWCYSSRHCQWTVTGSGMALFWILLGSMPANGISPLTHRVTVHLPHEHSQEAKTQVLQHLLAADGKLSPQGTLPPGYNLVRDYAETCAMAAFAYTDYDEVQPIHQHLDQLDRDKLAKESMAEWQDIVRFEFDMGKRRALASLYNTLDGCDLSLLNSPGLVEMLSTLTTPVEGDPKRVYFTSPFHRAGLALCVTLDGKVVEPLSAMEADRRLHLSDAFVQMSLIGNKAKKLVRDRAYNNNRAILAQLLKAPAEALEGPAGQREGPAGQWRTKKWFKAVLFAAENQGPRCKTAAANEAEVRCNTDGTAAKYLEEVDYYRHRGWVMAPERHLAWYLNMLRNALGHAESADMTLSPVQASASAFALLLDSPVVQPTATIPKRFNAIRHAKLP